MANPNDPFVKVANYQCKINYFYHGVSSYLKAEFDDFYNCSLDLMVYCGLYSNSLKRIQLFKSNDWFRKFFKGSDPRI